LATAAPGATIGSLRSYDFRADESVGTDEIDEAFRADRSFPGVIVTRDGDPIGLVSRTFFYEWLSRPYGTPLYYKRPLAKLHRALGVDPLVIDGGMSIADAASIVLSRASRFVYEPVIVSQSQAWRILDVHSLLQSLAYLYYATAKENERVLEETNRQSRELHGTLMNLRETQDQLIEAKKIASLAQLVTGVAHEINTPVGISITANSTLRNHLSEFMDIAATGRFRRKQLDEFMGLLDDHTKIIEANMTRAAKLVQDFKAVSVAETGGSLEEFDLKVFLDGLVASLEPTVRKQGHKITLKCVNSATVVTYPGALSQIVTNLVMNALAHAFVDMAGEVTVSASTDPKTIYLSCSDNGVGIPEEFRQRIFEPFFTTKRGLGGTGLGLHIVYNLVKQKLQGTIAMRSICPGGTSFVMTFPTHTD